LWKCFASIAQNAMVKIRLMPIIRLNKRIRDSCIVELFGVLSGKRELSNRDDIDQFFGRFSKLVRIIRHSECLDHLTRMTSSDFLGRLRLRNPGKHR
jgi:hypothetical protein